MTNNWLWEVSRSWFARTAAALTATLLGAVGLATAVGAGGLQRSQPQRPSSPPVVVLVERVRATAHELPPLSLAGRVEAVRRAMVGFEVGGSVDEVLVEEGDAVAAGQPLARLGSQRLAAALAAVDARLLAARAQLEELVAGPRQQWIERARAAVTSARARAELAAATARRHLEALRSEAISAQAEEEARRDAEAAAAALDEAQAQLDELLAGSRAEQIEAQRAVVAELEAQRITLARDVSDAELRAPFAARIQARHVERGSVVAAGAAAFSLVGTAELRVRVGVPAALAASGVAALAAAGDGLAVDVLGDVVDVDVAAATVLPMVDARVRTVDLLLPVTPAAAASLPLRDGVRASVRVSSGVREGVAVPVAALTAGPRGLFRCLVAEPDGAGGHVARNRDVFADQWLGERVLVRGALVDGDLLVVSGADHVLAGMRVRPEEVR